MNRREFLKIGGTLSTGILFFSSPLKGLTKQSAKLSAGGTTYRGTVDGDIFASEDDGKSWRLHPRLGPQYSISHIFSGRDGRIYLFARYKMHSFHLSLTGDGKYWTAEPVTLATLWNMA
jgi:hypothetical protein